MNWILQRYSKQNNSTQGLLMFLDGVGFPIFFSHVIEDDDQGGKGDRRFPAGKYQLKIHPVVTPKTEFFRSQLPWFEFFVEVTGIPGFDLVFVHPGNDQNDTEGCLLLNDQMGNNSFQNSKEGALSRQACERWYKLVYPQLKMGATMVLEVRDEERLK